MIENSTVYSVLSKNMDEFESAVKEAMKKHVSSLTDEEYTDTFYPHLENENEHS